MVELIVPKPAVAAGIAIVSTGLSEQGYDAVFVSNRLPGPEDGFETLPDWFVKLSRIGGGMVNKVTDSARLLAECYGIGSADTEMFSNTCIALLKAARGRRFASAFIRGFGDIDGHTDFPDPGVPTHERWQFHGSLLVSTN